MPTRFDVSMAISDSKTMKQKAKLFDVSNGFIGLKNDEENAVSICGLEKDSNGYIGLKINEVKSDSI